jgi:hypothetical protein
MDEQQRAKVAEERELLELASVLDREEHHQRRARRRTEGQRPPKVSGVAWRCEPCSRSLGRHTPALAILERVDGPRPWVIRKLATWGQAWDEPGKPRVQSRMLSPHTQTNDYACRRCRYKPRVKAPELFALADRAHAEGRDYFYR